MRKLLIAGITALSPRRRFAAEVGGVKLDDKVARGRAGARAERRGDSHAAPFSRCTSAASTCRPRRAISPACWRRRRGGSR